MNIASKQTGVGLIEVMVALLLLSIAILGYSALQAQAIKSTDEAFERTQSLVMMRALAEKIRANPAAITTYEAQLNAAGVPNVPSQQCGLNGQTVTALCTPAELAIAESYQFKIELSSYDFQIQMHPCPNTGGTGTDASTNIMFSYCLLSAWGDTTPTIGTDDEVDCLTERVVDEQDNIESAGGNYYPSATCMMMEI
ncbi:type IV pilus modification protein PilV [Psychrobacter sp. Marseille-P5312]|uniref:type IV pilus modification protein PilV n=1 Tax=Psychrobacter sp. Marseille-P5312 TaxID=2086574 RepID=UPI000CF6E79B|nr:type IV pilus modification protein PilV [Psychrobacter sp. Marseille-P5312]